MVRFVLFRKVPTAMRPPARLRCCGPYRTTNITRAPQALRLNGDHSCHGCTPDGAQIPGFLVEFSRNGSIRWIRLFRSSMECVRGGERVACLAPPARRLPRGASGSRCSVPGALHVTWVMQHMHVTWSTLFSTQHHVVLYMQSVLFL